MFAPLVASRNTMLVEETSHEARPVFWTYSPWLWGVLHSAELGQMVWFSVALRPQRRAGNMVYILYVQWALQLQVRVWERVREAQINNTILKQIQQPVLLSRGPSFKNLMMPSIDSLSPFIFQFPPTKNLRPDIFG